MKNCLIIVDMQKDFLPGGALGVTDGHRIIRPIIDLSSQSDLVVLTRDWHPADHISFSTDPKFEDKSWPPHCVQATPGAEIDSEILDAFPGARIFSKGFERDKEAYSGFDGFDFFSGESLASHLTDEGVEEVDVVGLALDYCVKATALDAQGLGFDTTVVLDCTRFVDYETGARAVSQLALHWVGLAVSERPA